MTAIVSALANQQSEDESTPQCGSLESLDMASMHFVPKDLHNLSRMFIQANLLPRPRSDSNFQMDYPGN